MQLDQAFVLEVHQLRERLPDGCREATFELADVYAGDLAEAGDDEIAACLRVGEHLLTVDGSAVLGDGSAPAVGPAHVPPAPRHGPGVEGVRAGAEPEVVAAV